MPQMDENLLKMCSHVNVDHVPDFKKDSAPKNFLNPLGLAVRKDPPPTFSSNSDVLTSEEELNIFKAFHYIKWRVQKGIKDNHRKLRDRQNLYAIRGRICSANTRLVRYCIRQFLVKGDHDELQSRGNTALLRSIDAFDPWRKNKFSTYACQSIKRGFFQKTSRGVPLEGKPIESISEVDLFFEKESRHEKTTQKMHEVMHAIGSGANLEAMEILIIMIRFFFEAGSKTYTLSDVGDIFGLSKERIRQIQKKGINKIQKELKIQGSID